MITTLQIETKDIYDVSKFLVFQSFNLFDNFCRKLVAYFLKLHLRMKQLYQQKKELIESFL